MCDPNGVEASSVLFTYAIIKPTTAVSPTVTMDTRYSAQTEIAQLLGSIASPHFLLEHSDGSIKSVCHRQCAAVQIAKLSIL
jgi:hypothetical protein